MHHPAINEAMVLLQAAMAHCGVLPYDEASGTGELRYVQAAVVDSSFAGAPSWDTEAHRSVNPRNNTSSSVGCSVQLTLVWNASSADAAEGTRAGARLEELAACLWQLGRVEQQQDGAGQQEADSQHLRRTAQPTRQRAQAPPLLHSLWANFQPARTNAILGPEWRLLRGEEEAWARLGGVDICFGPGSFMQARRGVQGRCSALTGRVAGAVGGEHLCACGRATRRKHFHPTPWCTAVPPLRAGQPWGHESGTGSHAGAGAGWRHHC